MTHQLTHYDILGVSFTASRMEIKRAYNKKVILVHPDKTNQPNSSSEFIQLQEAYEILSSPESRKEYDESLPELLKTTRIPKKSKKDPYPNCIWTRNGNIFTLINSCSKETLKVVTKQELDQVPNPFQHYTLKQPEIRVLRHKLKDIKFALQIAKYFPATSSKT